MAMSYEEYMRQVVQPMRDELTSIGFQELRTEEEVEEKLGSAKGTALVFVNSVCGCAAGLARPAAGISLKHHKVPDHLFTVFAGQDKEATAKARTYFGSYPPSSPSIALLKDGEIVHMIERHHIENNGPEEIARMMIEAFDQYC